MSDFLDLCAANANRHLGPCAEVRVGDHVTRYVKRGTGSPPIVVVSAGPTPQPAWAALIEALGAKHRMVFPEPPPTNGEFTGWVRGFVEGVGLSGVVVLAGGLAYDAAAELTVADAFTFRGVVLVPGDDGRDRSGQPADGTTASSPSTLVVVPEWAPEEVVRQVEAFIAGLDPA